jgi:ribosome-binding protein aMBF1 (putative translation factor)
VPLPTAGAGDHLAQPGASMMHGVGRPERPIKENGLLADFARDLREARAQVGLSYRQMAEVTHFSVTVLSCAANGKAVPTWEVAWEYLRACGIHPSLKPIWHDRWSAARASATRPRYGPA